MVTRTHLHSYDVRSRDNHINNIQRSTKTFMQKQLFVGGLRLFNDFPDETKDSRNVCSFSKRLVEVYGV